MTSSIQERARSILREAGPMTSEELLERLNALQPISGKNPGRTMSNALRDDLAIQRVGRSRYVYLPTFIRGARVRVPVELAAPERGLLVIGVETYALLWPEGPWGRQAQQRTITLEAGPTFSPTWDRGAWPGSGLRSILELPRPFWAWWEVRQRAGCDSLLLSCEDGEAGRYLLKAIRTSDLDPEGTATANTRLREDAASLAKAHHEITPSDLAYGLLAHGAYRSDPPPDPLYRVLFAPGELFYIDHMRLTYRSDLTPALRRVFARRFESDWLIENTFLRVSLEETSPLQALSRAQAEMLEEAEVSKEIEPDQRVLPIRPAEMGYRFKVSLLWKREVWRVIEMLDNQTLEDLHYAIQDAFHWDDDHLYAFYLSGRAWDRLTEVGRPEMDTEAGPPLADEVELAELGLKPKQTFLYIFDFGDELRHGIEVLDTFPAPKRGKFPRIAESHGKAPPQYPRWD